VGTTRSSSHGMGIPLIVCRVAETVHRTVSYLEHGS